MKINIINLGIQHIENPIKLDGIEFKHGILIELLLDSKDFRSIPGFEDSVIVFEELNASKISSGKYLIFTCACGAADDGGWEGVYVQHEKKVIIWEILIDSTIIKYAFNREQYITAINNLASMIREKYNRVDLIPNNFIYPEDW